MEASNSIDVLKADFDLEADFEESYPSIEILLQLLPDKMDEFDLDKADTLENVLKEPEVDANLTSLVRVDSVAKLDEVGKTAEDPMMQNQSQDTDIDIPRPANSEGDQELLHEPNVSAVDDSSVTGAPGQTQRIKLTEPDLRLKKNTPKLRVIDIPKPKFIDTYLISAPDGDNPLPSSEFFYNYRNFYSRHRTNWREMKKDEVFKPSLDVIDEDSPPDGSVSSFSTGVSPRVQKARPKSKDGKSRRRVRKFFGKWKAAADFLLLLQKY